MTVGAGIAIAGMWIGVGVIAYGSPAVAAMAAFCAFVMTVGLAAQSNEHS